MENVNAKNLLVPHVFSLNLSDSNLKHERTRETKIETIENLKREL